MFAEVWYTALGKLCTTGNEIQKKLDPRFTYYSPSIHLSGHFNRNDKGQKHSKDPQNCPFIFFYDTTHFLLVSFFLCEPIMVIEIRDDQLSKIEFNKLFGQPLSNEYHLTFCTFVHNFILKMV